MEHLKNKEQYSFRLACQESIGPDRKDIIKLISQLLALVCIIVGIRYYVSALSEYQLLQAEQLQRQIESEQLVAQEKLRAEQAQKDWKEYTEHPERFKSAPSGNGIYMTGSSSGSGLYIVGSGGIPERKAERNEN